MCFNSLQTGKRITSYEFEVIVEVWKRFQFPSNGKAYHKISTIRRTICWILFQFPSNGKAYHKADPIALSFLKREFQFPSNGKAYHKLSVETTNARKSEFQFPSNGKAYHKFGTNRIRNDWWLVSIPFKRESVSQGYYDWYERSHRRVSIPFKRESVSQVYREGDCARTLMTTVSIPFKRESVSQEITWTSMLTGQASCFNSLQTGKRITSETTIQGVNTLHNLFQFPSNGKAYHKTKPLTWSKLKVLRFNSLQTGKRITSLSKDWLDGMGA